MVIWKYTLTLGKCVIKTKKNAEILTVGTQADEAVVWMLLDERAEDAQMVFRSIATGEPIEYVDYLGYIETLQFTNGLVFHVFCERGD